MKEGDRGIDREEGSDHMTDMHVSRATTRYGLRTSLPSISSTATMSTTNHVSVHQVGPPATALVKALNAATPATIVMRVTLLRVRLHARSSRNMLVCGDRALRHVLGCGQVLRRLAALHIGQGSAALTNSRARE